MLLRDHLRGPFDPPDWESPPRLVALLRAGRPLPTPPLWLTEDLEVLLDLEASCAETCATFGAEARLQVETSEDER
jgi:hypothetical protein